MIIKTTLDKYGKNKLSIGNGFKDIFTGDFFKKKSVLNDFDVEALKKYNQELKKVIGYTFEEGKAKEITTDSQTAFNRTMLDASEYAQTLAESFDGKIVKLEEIETQSKAAKTALKGLSIVGNMAASFLGEMALEAVIGTISDIITYEDRLAESARNIGTEFKSTQSDIEGYKKQIQELANVINDPNSSIEEVTTARQNLLTVQDEMIAKFGEEASAADLVTQALNGQTDAFNKSIDAIGRREFDKAKNKFMDENSGIGDWLSNLWYGYDDSWDAMQQQMNSAEISFANLLNGLDSSERSNLIPKYKELFKNYGIEVDNIKGIVIGNAYDIEEALNNMIPKLNGDALKNVQSVLGDIQSTIADYGDLYNQDVLYNKIIPNEELNTYFNNLTSAKEAYDNAFVSGKVSEIDAATQSYANLYNQIQAISNGDTGLINFFENLFPSMDSIVKEWNFTQDFKNNVDGMKDSLTSVGEVINKLGNNGDFSFFDILGNPKEYDALSKFASKYSMTVEELVGQMQKLKLVHSDQYRELLKHFSQDQLNQLTDEDLEFAYKIKIDYDFERSKVKAELEDLQKGGSVNLLLRPKVDTSELKKAGWNVPEGDTATVFTNTFSNKDGTVAMNFTPIIVDPNTGKVQDILTEDALTKYAEDVISGVREDDLNLKIGGRFEGKNAIEQAVNAAEYIHELQEKYYSVDDSVLVSWDDFITKIQLARRAAENSVDINSRASLEGYQTASQGESHLDDYNSYKSMIEEAKKLYDAGHIGSEKFKAAARALSENGMDDPENFIENLSYIGPYFTEGADGLQKFVQKMGTLKDEDGELFAKWNEDTQSWSLNLKDIESLAEQLHMPLELVSVLLEGLQEYGFTNDYFGNMDDGVKHLSTLYSQLAQEEAKLSQMEADGVTGTAFDEQKEKVESLKESINITKQGMEDLLNMTTKSLEEEYEAAEDLAKSLTEQYKNLDPNSKAYEFQKQALESAMATISEKYGIQFEFTDDGGVQIKETLSTLHEKAEKTKQKLNDLRVDGKLNLDDSDVKAAYEEFVKLRKAELEAQNPLKLNVDASAVNPQVLDILTNLHEKINEISIDKELGLDTTKAEEDLQAFLTENKEILTALGIDISSYETVKQALESEPIKIPVEYTTTDIGTSSLTEDGTVSIDVEIKNKGDLDNLNNQLSEIPKDTPANINCTVSNEDQFEQVKQLLSSRPNTTATISVIPDMSAFGTSGVGGINWGSLIPKPAPVTVSVDAQGNVNYVNASQEPPVDKNAGTDYKNKSQEPPIDMDAGVNYKLLTQDPPTSKNTFVNYLLGSQALPESKTVKVNYVDNGSSVNGTAHANGTTILSSALTNTWHDYMNRKPNAAFAGGKWGLPYDQTALVGEVGPELLV